MPDNNYQKPRKTSNMIKTPNTITHKVSICRVCGDPIKQIEGGWKHTIFQHRHTARPEVNQ